MADLHELIIRHGREAAREMVPARQRSLVDIAAEILTAETNDFAATYAGFCLTSLPHRDPGVRTWEGAWGFQPDDALYLLGPAAWTGALLLAPAVLLSAIATSIMAVVIWVRLERLRRRVKASAA